MPPYIFQYLTDAQKNEIKTIQIMYDKNDIQLFLRFFVSIRCFFHYERSGADTEIFKLSTKQEITVENSDYLDVFCADLKAILINQKIALEELKILQKDDSGSDNQYKTQYLDPISKRIINCIQDARNQKLHVTKLWPPPTGIIELKRLLSTIDLRRLEEITVDLETNEELRELAELEEFVEAAPLNLVTEIAKPTLEELVMIKEIVLTTRTIRQLRVWMDRFTKDHLNELFGIPNDDNSLYGSTPIPNRPGDFFVAVIDPKFRFIDFYRSKFFEKTENLVKINAIYGNEDISIELNFLFKETLGNSWEGFENPLIMKHILEYCGCMEIQSLRKVSSNILRIIEIVKPDPKISEITICAYAFSQFEVRVCIGEGNLARYLYAEEDSDFLFSGKLLITPNPYQKAFQDIHSNLRDQSTPLKKLEFKFAWTDFQKKDFSKSTFASVDELGACSDKIFNLFKDIMKFPKKKLSVESLFINVFEQAHIQKVMSQLQSKTLKSIKIWTAFPFREDFEFLIDEVSKMDQWKQAEELKMVAISIPPNIEGIIHFSKASVRINVMTAGYLFGLKEELLKSTKLIKFGIKYLFTTIDESSYDILGIPYMPPNDPMADARKTWYYQYPNEDKVLLVLFHINRKIVTLSRVDIDSIPDSAVL